MGLLKATTNIIGLIKDSDIKDRFVKLGAVAIMMWHADRLENARCAYCSDDVLEVVSTMQLHAAVVILPFIPFFYMLQECDPGDDRYSSATGQDSWYADEVISYFLVSVPTM